MQHRANKHKVKNQTTNFRLDCHFQYISDNTIYEVTKWLRNTTYIEIIAIKILNETDIPMIL